MTGPKPPAPSRPSPAKPVQPATPSRPQQPPPQRTGRLYYGWVAGALFVLCVLTWAAGLDQISIGLFLLGAASEIAGWIHKAWRLMTHAVS